MSAGLNIRDLASAVRPPLADAHARTWELLRLDAIYRVDESRTALFVLAMQEICAWHYERNPLYRRFCDQRGFQPLRDLGAAADLERLPALSAALFKQYDLATPSEATLVSLSSSGTGGRPTAAALDAETLLRMWRMGEATAVDEGIVCEEPTRYVVFAPPPTAAPGHGNPLFFTTLTQFAPAQEIVYALCPDRQDRLRLDIAAIETALRHAVESERPVRLIGLPALIASAAEALVAAGITLDARTLVLTGGGWKRDAGVALTQHAFRALLGRAFGIAAPQIRDLYGMTEHAVHYLECREHNFHAPVFSRVRVVDPVSRRQVESGEDGVLLLLNPGFTTMPFQALITADVGRAVAHCACGRQTPAFQVRGRGGQPRHRGCAATTIARVRR